ncbi:MAG: cytochrome P450 [Pseudomonadota bacterium]
MRRAPGPRGTFLLGNLSAFRRDPLGCLAQAAQGYGDIVRLRFGPVTAHLLNHPDDIEAVLSRGGRAYDKATRSASRIAATTGRSLLSGDHQAWQRHRRLIQPVFQPSVFSGIDPELDRLIDPMVRRWVEEGQVDLVDEMMQLVISAAIRVLFSEDIDPRRIIAPLEVALADTWRRIEAPFDLSMLSERLHRRAFRRAVAALDALVLDLIQARRGAEAPPDDVLTRLLDAHAAEGDSGLSDTELRDATLTLLLAGHETTANALAWALFHAAERFETAPPARIFAEALRLHPSIWIIERRATRALEIDGYAIPRGSSVLISPFLLHRRRDFWPDPEQFDPERFAERMPRAREGYLPFGLGSHRCVGLYLANRIALRVIERVFAQVRLHHQGGPSPRHAPGITLRHANPVWVRVTSRTGV